MIICLTFNFFYDYLWWAWQGKWQSRKASLNIKFLFLFLFCNSNKTFFNRKSSVDFILSEDFFIKLPRIVSMRRAWSCKLWGRRGPRQRGRWGGGEARLLQCWLGHCWASRSPGICPGLWPRWSVRTCRRWCRAESSLTFGHFIR